MQQFQDRFVVLISQESFYRRGVRESVRSTVQQRLGFVQGSLEINYLGVPLFEGVLESIIFESYCGQDSC